MTGQHTARLRGRRVLVVEDDYMIAVDLMYALEDSGAEVLGPVASVEEALNVIETEQVHGASLDINLSGEAVYPVADALAARGVPFIFVSGYDSKVIPKVYAGIPHCDKPVNSRTLADALATVLEAK